MGGQDMVTMSNDQDYLNCEVPINLRWVGHRSKNVSIGFSAFSNIVFIKQSKAHATQLITYHCFLGLEYFVWPDPFEISHWDSF